MKQFIDNIKYRFRTYGDYFTWFPVIGAYRDGWAISWFNKFFVVKLPANEKIKPSITLEVKMKRVNERFYCYQTLKGKDYLFVAKTADKALKQMEKQVRKIYSSTGRLDVTLKIKN